MRVAVVGGGRLVRHGLVLQLAARGVAVHAEVPTLAALPVAPTSDAVLLVVTGAEARAREAPSGAADLLARGVAVLALTPGTRAGTAWADPRSGGDATAGWRAGGALDVMALEDAGTDEIVGWLAVSGGLVGATPASPAPGPAPRVLTTAERDVLGLLAQGLSNAGIADVLSLSHRTVESHVSSLFVKLGLADGDPSRNRRVAAALRWHDRVP